MSRRREPRITSLETYPKKWVLLVVAAEWLEIDTRTLSGMIDEGLIRAVKHGKFNRIHIDELKAFHSRNTAA